MVTSNARRFGKMWTDFKTAETKCWNLIPVERSVDKILQTGFTNRTEKKRVDKLKTAIASRSRWNFE